MSATGIEARVVELETRLAFQEQAMAELSDALAEARLELSRNDVLLRRALDELQSSRPGVTGDPADEPPPPHY
ncbi:MULTISPECIES: SlyX family protein [unclassified Luteimonas]|uniref:SlyX family protein n=1 Tax=unclassified Luteimonas TaxID=2629088 RepID=UPI0018F073BA|nr:MULTISPECIES: SlyX family protein [unclassified Luteimonas]MBJ6977759.1 SlyX family protein [Luteimonas sp. MC1895]MBJ6984577.1 SlyX family protein [Luteimonas sp. MC1750]QQO04818.1 SlyX family protein [Luteimonas sp. MC1750]